MRLLARLACAAFLIAYLVPAAAAAEPGDSPRRIAFGAVRAPVGQRALVEVATRELRRELAAAPGLDVVPIAADSAEDSAAAARRAGERIRLEIARARQAGAAYVCLAEIRSARSLLYAPMIGRRPAESETRGGLVVLRTADGCVVADLEDAEKLGSNSAESDRARALATATERVFARLGCAARRVLAVTGRVYAMAGKSEVVVIPDPDVKLRKGATLRIVRPPAAGTPGAAGARPDLEIGTARVSRVEPARWFARPRGGITAHAGDLVYGVPEGPCR